VRAVGAGFSCGLQQRAGDVAELRIVIAGGDFEFLERIGVGIDDGEPRMLL